jgi:predicted deacylase
VAVTVEHRGQRDVSYELAQHDATAIIDYLTHLGAIEGAPRPLPALRNPATPLAGSEQFYAPCAGVLVHRAAVGSRIEAGQALFDIVDPHSGQVTTVNSHNTGVLYMRRDVRFVKPGDPLGRVSGATPIRSGKLLSA